MKCQRCSKDFLEKEIEKSHDVPKYMGGSDKNGSHWLCKECHDKYEELVLVSVYKELFGKNIIFSKDRRKNIPFMFKIKCFKSNKKIDIVLKIKKEFFKDDTPPT